jgi:hypothetical protein
VKAIYDKTTASIIVNGEKLKPFSLKSGMRQRCPGITSQSNRQKEEIKGIQIGKETVKMSLFTDDMILHLKDPKKLYPKTRHRKQL